MLNYFSTKNPPIFIDQFLMSLQSSKHASTGRYDFYQVMFKAVDFKINLLITVMLVKQFFEPILNHDIFLKYSKMKWKNESDLKSKFQVFYPIIFFYR